MNEPSPSRHIRSYVLRQGRMTQAQRRALDELWPRYGLDPTQPFHPEKIFGRRAPLYVEIGFGNGETLARFAEDFPDRDFLGIEVHRPGVGHLLLRIEEKALANVRLYCADAVEICQQCLEDASVDGILVLFPDPWPKKRHHKRRLLSPDFVALAARKLKRSGLFHAATDWEDYAREMLEVLEACGELKNLADTRMFGERPLSRPLTKFELRGQKLGHPVRDLVFMRRK